ncbi:MAG: diguanylate cyclase [Desulfonauticus sp.]|nr:diguanylate cyclase [Desulfonauticus sp.]
MSIIRKIIVIYLIIFVVFLIINYFILHFILFKSSLKIEENKLKNQYKRVNTLVDGYLKNIEIFNYMLINTDVLHYFINSNTKQRKLLAEKILKKLNFDGLVIFDGKGNILFMSFFDKKNNNMKMLLNKLKPNIINTLFLDNKNNVTGFLPINSKNISIVSILKFKFNKKDYMFLDVIFLNKARLNNIINCKDITFNIQPIVEGNSLNNNRFLTGSNSFDVDMDLKNGLIFWKRKDIFGNKSILLSIKQNKSIYKLIKHYANKYFLLVSILLMIFIFMIIILLRKIILNSINNTLVILEKIRNDEDFKLVKTKLETEFQIVLDKFYYVLNKIIINYDKLFDKFSLYSVVLEQSPDIIFLYDFNTDSIVKYNYSFKKYFGYHDDEIKTLSIYDLFNESRENLKNLFEELIDKRKLIREVSCIDKEGKFFYIELSIFLIEFKDQKIASILARDITEKKVRQKKIQYLAYHDALTGLPNRLYFFKVANEVLNRCKEMNKKFALCYVDVNDFKIVNDLYGHDAGDRLLIEVSRRIKQALRDGDFVARLGGDEFVFIIENFKDLKLLSKVVQKVIEVFASPFYIQGEEIIIHISIGISVYPEHGVVLNDLLKASDEAMYRAKEQKGSGYIIYRKEEKL